MSTGLTIVALVLSGGVIGYFIGYMRGDIAATKIISEALDDTGYWKEKP